ASSLPSPLSLHDALPISSEVMVVVRTDQGDPLEGVMVRVGQERSVSDDEGVVSFSLPVDSSATLSAECPPHTKGEPLNRALRPRSEEHTSELQSRENLVC